MRFHPARLFNFLFVAFVFVGATAPMVMGEDYTYSLDDVSGFLDGQATVTMSLDSGDGEALGGFSVAVCHDAKFVGLDDSENVVNGQAVADETFLFHSVSIVDDEGWTVGSALSIGAPLEAADGLELYKVTYDLLAVGDTDLEFCSIGTPIVFNSVVLDSTLEEIGTDDGLCVVDGSISITEPVFPVFIRGDCNDDGAIGLADGVRTVAVVFDEAVVNCAEACNVDNAGGTDVKDALALFNYLFLEAAEPAAPFPDCGFDEDPDGKPVKTDCGSSSCD